MFVSSRDVAHGVEILLTFYQLRSASGSPPAQEIMAGLVLCKIQVVHGPSGLLVTVRHQEILAFPAAQTSHLEANNNSCSAVVTSLPVWSTWRHPSKGMLSCTPSSGLAPAQMCHGEAISLS